MEQAWTESRLLKALKISKPIVQGPFGGGASSVTLAAAVSNAGGLGSFGAHYMTSAEIKKLVEDLRSRTSKPFAINLWVSDHDEPDGFRPTPQAFQSAVKRLSPYFTELKTEPPSLPTEEIGQRFEEQIEAIISSRPPVASFVFGVPPASIIHRLKEANIATIGTATTPDEAAALEAAGIDVIVASGFEAGGHRGSFIRSAEDSLTGLVSLIPQVVDRVRVPVVAAGGIADHRGIIAALALGASGVQIGTAFLACEESNAAPLHREALFSAAAAYTSLTRVFSGRLARGIRNRIIEEVSPHASELLRYPAQVWLAGKLRGPALAQGRTDVISLWSGQSAPLLKHKRAAELFSSLVQETERTLSS